jgi:GNAT superfamily N-acetyltransferase
VTAWHADARPYDHMAIHPYPSSLRDTMELPGGIVATIRPIRPEDAAIESAFVHGLSEQSKFLRFMFGLRDLTPAMLSRFTQIDYDRELALIAVIDTPQGEQQIGVVRYTTLPDEETCEFAIVVGDDWQGKGLARRMFTRLIEAARDRRIKVMTGGPRTGADDAGSPGPACLTRGMVSAAVSRIMRWSPPSRTLWRAPPCAGHLSSSPPSCSRPQPPPPMACARRPR